MRLYQHLQFQFDTPGFILVSSLFIFRTLFLNSENPESITLNAFTYLIILSACKPSLATRATLNFCKDHLFTLLGLSYPPVDPCHSQAPIPPGDPLHLPRLWHTSLPTLLFLSLLHRCLLLLAWAPISQAGLLLPFPCMDTFFPLPRLWCPALGQPLPPRRNPPLPSQALTLCWDTLNINVSSPFLGSDILYLIADITIPLRVGSSYPVQAPVTPQGNTPTQMPSRGQSDSDILGRLPLPWGALQHLIGLPSSVLGSLARQIPSFLCSDSNSCAGLPWSASSTHRHLPYSAPPNHFALNYLGRKQEKKPIFKEIIFF